MKDRFELFSLFCIFLLASKLIQYLFEFEEELMLENVFQSFLCNLCLVLGWFISDPILILHNRMEKVSRSIGNFRLMLVHMNVPKQYFMNFSVVYVADITSTSINQKGKTDI